MKLRRLENPKGYTTLPTKTIADDRISYRAVGLLAYLLSRPDGWETDSKRLAAGEGREGRDAVRSALKELEHVDVDEQGVVLGYLHRVKVRRPAGMTLDNRYVGGQIRTEYFVSDHPTRHPGDRLELLDEMLPDAGDWNPGPGDAGGAKSGDKPVEPAGDNSAPGTGKPTPENPAPLTRPEELISPPSPGDLTSDSPQVDEAVAGLMAGAAPLGLATLADDPESPLGRSLEQMDLVGAAARLEPRLRMFALRAHLRDVMGYQPNFQEVYDWVEHAHESVGAHRRGRLTTAELVAYVASFYPASEPESSGLTAAAPLGGLTAAEPPSRAAELGSTDVPIPAGTSRPAQDA